MKLITQILTHPILKCSKLICNFDEINTQYNSEYINKEKIGMYSLQALKDYRDNIYKLCSSLAPEALDFFHLMEKKGIKFFNDTVENKIENIRSIVYYLDCIKNIGNYLNANQPLDYDDSFYNKMPASMVLTPQQLFETLVSRSIMVREAFLKLSCPHHLISRILRSLDERNLSEFQTIVENERLDLTNLSKCLSMTDIPNVSDMDDSLIELWMYSMNNKIKDIEAVITPQSQECKFNIVESPLMRWMFEHTLFEDAHSLTGILPSFFKRFEQIIEKVRNIEEEDENEVIDGIMSMCSFFIKITIIRAANLPPIIKNKIHETLAPYYFRPLIEKYESEWEDVQREQQIFISGVEQTSASPSEAFSLPEDFFTQKPDSSSFHMNIHPQIVKEGSKKFEEFLLGLAAEGYVDQDVLPLLAYRLTGCGTTTFGEDIITWHGDQRVIRYIIANMHEEGTNWVSKLDQYFIDENGETFLNTINADEARNIKKLNIYKRILKPYYGKVLRLP